MVSTRIRRLSLSVLYAVIVLILVQSLVSVVGNGSSSLVYASQNSFGSGVLKAQPTSSQVGPVSPSPPPPKPVGGGAYSHLGAKTSQDNDGVSAQIQVTNPSVKRGTYNFFAAWVMEHRDATAQRWIQVGWAEVGWKDDRQYVFVYDTQHQVWHWYEQFSISSGSWIQVRITYRDTTVWQAWLWWNSSWVLLDSADVGFSSPEFADQFGEVYLVSGAAFFVPDTSFYGSRLLIAGSWNLWDTSYSTLEYNVVSPYEAHWLSKYWSWHFHSVISKKG